MNTETEQVNKLAARFPAPRYFDLDQAVRAMDMPFPAARTLLATLEQRGCLTRRGAFNRSAVFQFRR